MGCILVPFWDEINLPLLMRLKLSKHLATGFDQLHGLPIKRPLRAGVAQPLPFGLSAALQPFQCGRSGGSAAMESALFGMLLGWRPTLQASAAAHALTAAALNLAASGYERRLFFSHASSC